MLICSICTGQMVEVFQSTVLGKHTAQYDYCKACGFLRARSPHWLDEAYSSALSAIDTGLVARNLLVARKLLALLYFVFDERGDGQYVDVAGGMGLLTRLMRDDGLDFYWSDKYCVNEVAKGFEAQSLTGACRAVTAIEVMEHVEDPLQFVIDNMAAHDAENFIFTTELFDGEPPLPENWGYYSLETGQHISFYQRRTLAAIASKMKLFFSSVGGMHVFSKKPLNYLKFRLTVGRANGLLTYWAKRQLHSKTMSDHEAMIRARVLTR